MDMLISKYTWISIDIYRYLDISIIYKSSNSQMSLAAAVASVAACPPPVDIDPPPGPAAVPPPQQDTASACPLAQQLESLADPARPPRRPSGRRRRTMHDAAAELRLAGDVDGAAQGQVPAGLGGLPLLPEPRPGGAASPRGPPAPRMKR